MKLGRFVSKVFSRLPFVCSYILLVISVLISLTILIPNCFNRIPVLSYFISECELPTTYELHGEVRVLDKTDNIINKNVEVFVGGYSVSLGSSTEFSLKFVSPEINAAFVVIRYEVNGEISEVLRRLVIENRNHVIRKEFTIYV